MGVASYSPRKHNFVAKLSVPLDLPQPSLSLPYRGCIIGASNGTGTHKFSF